jgi:hypothetical protein
MPSLSSYDVGRKSFEGRRYLKDIEAGRHGMETLLTPIWEYNAKSKKHHEKRYAPRMVFCEGNHEHRIIRAVDADPKLDGVLSLSHLSLDMDGWEFHDFLEPVQIDGISYCHYFPSGQLGRPCVSARAQLTRYHQSCVAGHQQGRDIAYGKRADGKTITGIIAGSFYQHKEAYLSPFTNQHWRGIYVFHEVDDGQFDEMPVSLNYLKKRYSDGTRIFA